MDDVKKIYKSKQLRGYSAIIAFLEEANLNDYDIISVTEVDGYYTVIYKDYKRS